MTRNLTGYFKLFTLNNIPIYIHWSFPLGGLFLSIYGGNNLHAAPYYCLAYTSLIMLHELAHLTAAKGLGHKVYSIYITAFSGECRMQLPNSIKHGILIYSAGLAIQLVAFVLALTCYYYIGKPDTLIGKSFFNTYTLVNAVLFIVNIIPQTQKNGNDNDGRSLWKLFRAQIQKGPLPYMIPANISRTFPPETRLLQLGVFAPKNFKAGIEILNDDKTPMEFVVNTLTNNIKMSQDQAIMAMIEIHQRGGKIIPFLDIDKARLASDTITSEAEKQGHHFICRAISIDD